MPIRIEHGKGGKDRYVMLSEQLLIILRRYWQLARSVQCVSSNGGGLCVRSGLDLPLGVRPLDTVVYEAYRYRAARRRNGVLKIIKMEDQYGHAVQVMMAAPDFPQFVDFPGLIRMAYSEGDAVVEVVSVMSGLVGKFENLSPGHREVFALFLMYGLPVSVTAFLKAVSFAGLKNPATGKNMASAQMGRIFRELKECGLIDGDAGYPWHVAEDAQVIISHPFVQDNYGKWYTGIEQQHEKDIAKYARDSWYFSNLPDEHKLALALQPLRLIINNPDLSERQRELDFQEKLRGVATGDSFWPLIMLLGDNPLAVWRMLDEEQQFIAFESLKAQVLDFKEPIDTLLNIAGEGIPAMCRFSLAELQLLTGNSAEAGKLLQDTGLSHMSNGWVSSIHGLQKYLDGDAKGAIELFELALKLYKKQTRKRKNYFPYLAGLFYVLAMMQEDVDKYRTRIKAFLAAAQSEADYDRQYFILLDLIFEFLDEEQPQYPDGYGMPRESWLAGNILDIIAYVIFKSWSKRGAGLKRTANWSKTRAKLERHGFGLMLKHLLLLLENNSHAVFARPVPAHEDWERALMRLEALAGQNPRASRTTQGAGARVAWLLEFNEHYSEVQPKLQKLTKQGRWTKGRNIALKKLATGRFTEADLTPADLKVISCIDTEAYYNGWGTDTSYFVNADRAIAMLAGHPAVIANDGRPVEITASSPDLVIKKNNNGGYTLSFSKDIPAKPGNKTTKISDHRFEVLEITRQHCEINRKIGKKLTVPEKGAGQLQKLVANLAPLVPVQSDLAGAGDELATVAAVSTLQVHLGPVDEGFAAEFLVEPIAGSGKFFHPGKGGSHILVELGKKKVQTGRDLKRERKFYRDVLTSSGAIKDMEEEPFRFYAEGPGQCLELLDALKTCDPKKLAVKWPEGEKLRLVGQVDFSRLALNIRKSGTDWFSVDGEVRLDDKTVMKMAELLKRVDESSSRFLSLGENGFLALEQSLYKQLKQLSSIAENGRVHALATSALVEIGENAGKLKASKYWKDHHRKWESSYDRNYLVPTTLQAGLRDYQVRGYKWLARLSDLDLGACLADDMGLGKTVQALALMLTRAAQGPALVVAPVSVVPNWISEIARFAPTLNVVWMVGGAAKRKKLLENLKPFDVVLCSYGVLAPDEKNLAVVEWDMVVLDEAQAIKNHTTKRARAAFSLNAGFRLVTTGTPMENHLGELWSIFRFVTPGFLGSYDRYNKRFINPIEADANSLRKQHLKALVSPFVLRRKKTQVLEELPEKTEITLSIEMSKEERAFYEALRLQAVENVNRAVEEGAAPHIRILAEIMRLRRSCCHPKLVDGKVNIESSKLAQLQNLLTDLRDGGHKVLIFSQFVAHLAIIREWLDKTGICYQYLDGSTPVKKRQKAVLDFQNGKGDCFLISLKAGGLGLNLTAANYVIHMDPWWNPAVEDQASDRAHRIGQKQPVTIYRLVMSNTIEEKILALHKTKRDLADSLLEGTDQTGRISAKELMALVIT